MALQGTGWVAIISDGPPVLLNTGDAPTFADPQAAITWSSSVSTSIKTDVNLKNLIGRGSGESLQMAFQGAGLGAGAAQRGPHRPGRRWRRWRRPAGSSRAESGTLPPGRGARPHFIS